MDSTRGMKQEQSDPTLPQSFAEELSQRNDCLWSAESSVVLTTTVWGAGCLLPSTLANTDGIDRGQRVHLKNKNSKKKKKKKNPYTRHIY